MAEAGAGDAMQSAATMKGAHMSKRPTGRPKKDAGGDKAEALALRRFLENSEEEVAFGRSNSHTLAGGK